eukprot:1337439-Pyramimonas_sp.AAC.1
MEEVPSQTAETIRKAIEKGNGRGGREARARGERRQFTPAAEVAEVPVQRGGGRSSRATMSASLGGASAR